MPMFLRCPILYALLQFTLTSSLIGIHTYNASGDLWTTYDQLFPNRLQSVFHSPTTLQEAHRQINEEDATDPERSNAIHCYDYSAGNMIGQKTIPQFCFLY
jgi:hypothetical protein